MQYFVPYGNKAWLAACIAAMILISGNAAAAQAGQNSKPQAENIFSCFLGAKTGYKMEKLSGFFAFASYTVMLAGAGAVLNQQYHIPLYCGILLMALLSLITVNSGLEKLVSVISRPAPVLAGIVLFLAVFTLIRQGSLINENIALLKQGYPPLLKTASIWWLSGLLNGGMNLLIIYPLLFRLGSKNQANTVKLGQIWGVLIYISCIIILALALISCLPSAAQADIPNLLLTEQLNPAFGWCLGLLIFCAVFTTACPLLWTVGSCFYPKDTGGSKTKNCIIAAAGSIISLFVPFSILINKVYTAQGIIGIFLWLCICRKYLLLFIQKAISSLTFFRKDKIKRR